MVAQRELVAQVLADAGLLEEGGGRLRRRAQGLFGRILLRPGGHGRRQDDGGSTPERPMPIDYSPGDPRQVLGTGNGVPWRLIATAIRMVLA